MNEYYVLEPEGAGVRFALLPEGGPHVAEHGAPPEGYTLTTRLGDPDLLHCAVYRRTDGPGGLFVLHDGDGRLCAALAESNLAYGLGLAHMGRLVADARYGADIFEDLDDHD